jgi:serine/threonine protein kinase
MTTGVCWNEYQSLNLTRNSECNMCLCSNNRCDIWSVGVVLFELISNYKLFKGTSEKSTERAITRCHGFVASDSERGDTF